MINEDNKEILDFDFCINPDVIKDVIVNKYENDAYGLTVTTKKDHWFIMGDIKKEDAEEIRSQLLNPEKSKENEYYI